MSILYYKGKRGVVVRDQDEQLILVVENSDVIRKMLTRILFQFGISTDTAADGAEAVEKASTGVYDLILMDLAMPTMDGYEATRRIRSNEKRFDLPRAKIIAISAFGTEEQCRNCGMDDYLSKPINPVKLSEAVRKWLDRSTSGVAR